MKWLLFVVVACTLGSAQPAAASVGSRSQDLVVVQSKELPEAAQSSGQSLLLHSLGNGSTYLYVEQKMGRRLAIFDVTDPAHIKLIGAVTLDSPSAFDFVRDLNDSSTLVCFRDNKGAAVIDFRRAKQPSIVRVDALRQAARAESIGDNGLLMAAEPRWEGDIPAFDYQVVDTSDPRSPKLLATVAQVQKKVSDPATGATYLLGAEGLTVIRQPRVEERHLSDLSSN